MKSVKEIVDPHWCQASFIMRHDAPGRRTREGALLMLSLKPPRPSSRQLLKVHSVLASSTLMADPLEISLVFEFGAVVETPVEVAAGMKPGPVTRHVKACHPKAFAFDVSYTSSGHLIGLQGSEAHQRVKHMWPRARVVLLSESGHHEPSCETVAFVIAQLLEVWLSDTVHSFEMLPWLQALA